MDFKALIFYYFKKISSLASLGMAIIFLSHSQSAHYFILCAYFCIILTQAVTFLVCKDWSKLPHSIASESLFSEIWDISHWNFFVKFGHKQLMTSSSSLFGQFLVTPGPLEYFCQNWVFYIPWFVLLNRSLIGHLLGWKVPIFEMSKIQKFFWLLKFQNF